MAIIYNTGIVRSGLVLHLDAANVKSYPGSGTVWKDLSGYNSNATLVNGVGYSTDNKGTMVFDGVNDYAEVLNPFYQYGTEITVSAFCKFVSFQYILSQAKKNVDAMDKNVWLWHQSNNGLIWYVNDSGTWRSRGYTSLSANVWYHITTTASTSGLNIYVNGKNVGTGTGISTGITNTSDSGIGTTDYRYASSRPPMNGNISSIAVYNRSLTETQIQQNFNALRGRYGI